MNPHAKPRRGGKAKERAPFKPVPSTWRKPVDAAGELASWLDELADQSGVYIIRRPAWYGSAILYVGESHTGRLKKAILRHFQAPQSDHPKHYYDRANVEVRVVVAPSRKAIVLQYAVIQKYKPRDNELTGTTLDLSDVPF